MNVRKLIVFSLGAWLACSSALSLSCANRQSKRETVPLQSEVALPAATPELSAPPTANPAPNPTEVRETIGRVYQQTVTLDARAEPQFMSGDFNGDGSPDLAVAVKPAPGKIEEINHELANWMLKDPRQPVSPILKIATAHPAPEPAKAAPGESLLAIIHGYGRSGWRNPEARQSYLLKNAAGKNIEILSPASAMWVAKADRRFPRPRGEVIKKQLPNGVGILYWNGAEYAWRVLGSPSPRGK
ncbi:MAG TPA: FG-GAP repeat protein [Blastocatellia bacterium]|nr:FG-GAP repeat protein [Blastocatellia bacterium]